MDIEKYTTVAISILVAAIVKDVWDSFKKTTAQEVKKIKATSITRRLRLRLIVDAAFAVGLFAGGHRIGYAAALRLRRVFHRVFHQCRLSQHYSI